MVSRADLKDATEHALRDMIDFLMETKHMTRDDAYMLTSVAVDLDITNWWTETLGYTRCVRRTSLQLTGASSEPYDKAAVNCDYSPRSRGGCLRVREDLLRRIRRHQPGA
jgi:hypothetical protein